MKERTSMKSNYKAGIKKKGDNQKGGDLKKIICPS